MLYDVTRGYWDRTPYVIMVTDDLMFARSSVLEMAGRCASFTGMTNEQFACFERLFEEFTRDTSRSLYFSIRDDHFCIRESQVRVAVGGMSTI